MFRGLNSPSKHPQNFLQSFDLVCPISILTVFEWPELIKAFSIMWAQRKGSEKFVGWGVELFFYKSYNYSIANNLDSVIPTIQSQMA